jgi:hypothetical protein
LISPSILFLSEYIGIVSKDLIKEIENKGLKYQIASPGDHRLNHSETAIQTFKKHFIAILYGTDSGFPAKQ